MKKKTFINLIQLPNTQIQLTYEHCDGALIKRLRDFSWQRDIFIHSFALLPFYVSAAVLSFDSIGIQMLFSFTFSSSSTQYLVTIRHNKTQRSEFTLIFFVLCPLVRSFPPSCVLCVCFIYFYNFFQRRFYKLFQFLITHNHLFNESTKIKQ